MVIYGIFYGLLFRAINIENISKPNLKKNWVLPFFLTFLYGASDEFHQIFTPTRSPNPIDVSFDMIGASIAFLRVYQYI